MAKNRIILLSETYVDRELLEQIIRHLELCYEDGDYDTSRDDELDIDENVNEVFIDALRDIYKRDEFIRYFNELLEFGYSDEELNTEFQKYLSDVEGAFQSW